MLPETFFRSLRLIRTDGFRSWIVVFLLVVTLLGTWMGWFCLARVSVWVASESARLEVDRSVHPVESPVNGKVLAARMVAGQSVQTGDTLVELDGETQRLQLREEQARLATLSTQLEQLGDEVKAEAQVDSDEQQRAPLFVEEANAKYEEAKAAALFAQEEVNRLEKLHQNGLLPDLEYLRAKTEAQKREAAAKELELAINRTRLEQKTQISEHRVQQERLNRELGRVHGEMETSKSVINRLQYELEQQVIRAPIAGQLGEAAQLRPGSFLRSGERIAAIIPSGGLRAVGYFNPGQSLGRLQTGQLARIRLQSFPWTEYGSLQAVVTNVSSEIRDGLVRVEFSLQPDAASAIPLQHGLVGTAEVEVEKIAPIDLLLRMVGKRLETNTGPGHANL